MARKHRANAKAAGAFADGRTSATRSPIRLAKPVSFEGDVAIKGYEARSRTAYVEGVMHVKAQGMLSLWVAVDLNRRTVVGIEFFSADFGSVTEVPRPTIERRIVQQPKPAGGPDSGNCEHKGD